MIYARSQSDFGHLLAHFSRLLAHGVAALQHSRKPALQFSQVSSADRHGAASSLVIAEMSGGPTGPKAAQHKPVMQPSSIPSRVINAHFGAHPNTCGAHLECCDACHGTGRHAHFPARACSYCSGSGMQETTDAAAH